MPLKGTHLTIRVNGAVLRGTVLAADDRFISIDEGGVTAILRKDASDETWRMGKHSVTFLLETAPPKPDHLRGFRERLRNLEIRTRRLAR